MRLFNIIFFTTYRGVIKRHELCMLGVGQGENAVMEIHQRCASRRASGQSALVFEAGVILKNYSVLTPLCVRCLKSMSDIEAKRFVRGIEELNTVTGREFKQHIERTFP